MNKLILLLFLVFFINVNAQILTCEDFKSGTFTMTTTDSINAYDSIEYEFIRTGNSQIENYELNGEKIKIYAIIKWIDECSYIVTFDDSKMELDEFQQAINDNIGVVVKMINIKNNCYYYRSVLIIDGDEPMIIKGKICKRLI